MRPRYVKLQLEDSDALNPSLFDYSGTIIVEPGTEILLASQSIQKKNLAPLVLSQDCSDFRYKASILCELENSPMFS